MPLGEAWERRVFEGLCSLADVCCSWTRWLPKCTGSLQPTSRLAASQPAHAGAKHSQILSEALGNAGRSWDGVIKPSPSWKEQRPLIRVGSKAARHVSLCHSVHVGA